MTHKVFSADISRLKLDICNINIVDSDENTHKEPTQGCNKGTPRDSEPSDATSYGAASDIEQILTSQRMEMPDASTTMPLEVAPFKELGSMYTGEKHGNAQIRVKASVLSLRQCDRFCICQCHQITNLATSNSLSTVLGRLFIGYIGLPLLSHSKCNQITCRHRKAQVRVRIVYLFPIWFALRLIALTITKSSTTFMWKLDFPVVTQTAAPMFVLTSLGNTADIQTLLGDNTSALNAVEVIASKSPLHVSIMAEI